MKELSKPGRVLNEYINEDGTPKISCISCGRRPSISKSIWGMYLCGSKERYKRCNPNLNKPDYLLWTPRVDYSNFINEGDFNV